jgi:hypothetical protein
VQTGIQCFESVLKLDWIPAFAGMTIKKEFETILKAGMTDRGRHLMRIN